MNKMVIRGGRPLVGSVKINGAKNAVLPVLAASLLASEGTSRILEAPPLDDVVTMTRVLASLGTGVTFGEGRIVIDAADLHVYEAEYEHTRKMRASFLVTGPLLARLGRARVALPGGCAIGTRPVDQHLKGFEAMGAEISLGQGYIEAKVAGRLKGAKIYLDVPSVGATENIMMAATLAEGQTVIENAAKEPEIVDLANFLNAMGAKVRGAGTGQIRIEGVERLTGAEHAVIPDRIEAGTFMVYAAITGGNVYLEGAIADHLRPIISKMEEMGVVVEEDENGLSVSAPNPLVNVDVKTLPYPGFPTDMQAQMMALMTVSKGTGMMTETVFENRFMHVDELVKLGAQIKVEGRTAVVTGGARLSGAPLCATDLRAGAALIAAALAAEGESEITGLHHIERGYADLAGRLADLGADVRLEPAAPPATAGGFPDRAAEGRLAKPKRKESRPAERDAADGADEDRDLRVSVPSTWA